MKTYRKLDKLDKNFKKKVKAFMSEVGDDIFITESWRSQERQDYLYSLGRTIPGKIVTWTKTSNHQRGIAIDIAFYGSEMYPKDINKWIKINLIAEKYGIAWGYGLWGVDKPHFQDNGKPYKKESIFLPNSKYGKFIDISKPLPFNNYKETGNATIADIKELITLTLQRLQKK